MKLITIRLNFWISTSLVIGLFSTISYAAEPWYAGPLLSDPAKVTPIGHGYFQMHIYEAFNYGIFNANYNSEKIPLATLKDIDTKLNYGITKQTEIQLLIRYINNAMEGEEAGNLGDTSLTFAAQLVSQNERKWPPNIKFIFQQLFPTGRYDKLNPNLLATDATGQGSYLTSLGFNMEHVMHLVGEQYLVSFATAMLTLAKTVYIEGYSIYGGGSSTHGSIWPGNSLTFNLAAEYVPTQHLGFIIETLIYTQRASHFNGITGPIQPRFVRAPSFRRLLPRIIFNRLRPSYLNIDPVQDVGHGNVAMFTLAPAIDYSFTKNFSLTGGLWFSIKSKNSPAFYTPMINFTANW